MAFVDLLDGHDDGIEAIDERLERVLLQEERDARLADLLELRGDLALELRDRVDVDRRGAPSA